MSRSRTQKYLNRHDAEPWLGWIEARWAEFERTNPEQTILDRPGVGLTARRTAGMKGASMSALHVQWAADGDVLCENTEAGDIPVVRLDELAWWLKAHRDTVLPYGTKGAVRNDVLDELLADLSTGDRQERP